MMFSKLVTHVHVYAGDGENLYRRLVLRNVSIKLMTIFVPFHRIQQLVVQAKVALHTNRFVENDVLRYL